MPARPVVARHRVASRHWRGAPVRIGVISDLHVVAPWTSLAFLARAVARMNALAPDLVLIPGDFLADPKLPGRRATPGEMVQVLEGLSAPLGRFATLGNHDWADCPTARASDHAESSVARALAGSAIRHLDNGAVEVTRDGASFWVAGVDSMIGAGSLKAPKPKHDLPRALAAVPDGADLILLAHEPDLWVEAAPPAALTVSGHTHAGQIAFGRWRPLTPSRYTDTVAHGLVERDGRHLVVSAGLGCTGLPFRIGAPPEITLIDLVPSN